MRFSYPYADGVIAVSYGVADDLSSTIGLPRDRISVIYNPVVTAKMLEKSREVIKHPWFRDGEPPVILGVGRLTRAKDFPLLIRAFAEVCRRRAVRLMILGEGEERAVLEALILELGIGDRVSMPGFVQNPYAYMRHAAMFVLSSRWEGLPTALIEAMACGTSVVSTDCPSGPSEILENGQWGRLVPVGNVAALAEAMLVEIDSGPKRNDKLSKSFSDQNALDKYMRVLLSFDNKV